MDNADDPPARLLLLLLLEGPDAPTDEPAADDDTNMALLDDATETALDVAALVLLPAEDAESAQELCATAEKETGAALVELPVALDANDDDGSDVDDAPNDPADEAIREDDEPAVDEDDPVLDDDDPPPAGTPVSVTRRREKLPCVSSASTRTNVTPNRSTSTFAVAPVASQVPL